MSSVHPSRRSRRARIAPTDGPRRRVPAASLRPSLALACVATVAPIVPAQAQQFVFGDQALLEDAMHGLVARTIDQQSDHSLLTQRPCRLHLINDRHAISPFDEEVQDRVNAALADAVAESAHVDHCELDVWELQTGQPLDEIQTHLRSIEKDGVAMIVAYYPEPGGIMAFAKLEDTDGRLIASSGRYDLPVVPAAEGDGVAPEPAVRASASEDPSVLRLTGSSVIGQHLAPKLAESFMKYTIAPDDPDSVKVRVERDAEDPARVAVSLLERPESALQRIEIHSGGTETGTDALLEEEADVLMLAQQLGHVATGAFLDAFGVDMHSPAAEHVIGIDGVEFIVNEENRLSVVSREVIGEILTGRIEQWGRAPLHRSELDGEIVVVGSDEATLENSLINEAVLFGRAPVHDVSAATQAETTESVRREPLSIGYVSKDFRGANRAIDINECGVIYEPDDAATHIEDFEINTEDHPFARPVYLYTNPAVANPARDAFLQYAVSLAPGGGQEIVREHFVDLGLHLSGEESTDWRYYTVGDQPAELVDKRDAYRAAIRDARRLSATFRFRNDSFGMVLDSRAERDLEHLVEYLTDEKVAAERILLFGFADSVGAAEVNVALSEERAATVAARLQAAGIAIPPTNVQGIGEDAPIACNELPGGEPDLRGRYKNRRVEIWLTG